MIKTFPRFSFYRPSALIRVTGSDAFSFLQGQFTNELRQPIGSATYGLWLNQKGKVLADSHVLRLAENEFLVASVVSLAAIILQRLEQYVIADDVVLADETGNAHGLTVYGEGSGELLMSLIGAVNVRGQFWRKDDLLVFPGRRSAAESYEIIGPENTLNQLREKLTANNSTEASADAVELERIASDIPAIPQDIGAADLPNEAGLETTAISFTKGCYLGQEVMARLKNLGQVRRQLRRVKGNGPFPAVGTQLFQAGKKLGEIRSATATDEGFIAMAMLTRMGLDENVALDFQEPNQPGRKAVLWKS